LHSFFLVVASQIIIHFSKYW